MSVKILCKKCQRITQNALEWNQFRSLKESLTRKEIEFSFAWMNLPRDRGETRGGEDEMRRMCHWRVENAFKWRCINRRPHATVYDENGFSLKCPMLATLKAHQWEKIRKVTGDGKSEKMTVEVEYFRSARREMSLACFKSVSRWFFSNVCTEAQLSWRTLTIMSSRSCSASEWRR